MKFLESSKKLSIKGVPHLEKFSQRFSRRMGSRKEEEEEEGPERKFAGNATVQGPVPRASRSLAPNNCRGMAQKAPGHSAPTTITRIKRTRLIIRIDFRIRNSTAFPPFRTNLASLFRVDPRNRPHRVPPTRFRVSSS